jgi:hypothetical protein
MITLEKILTHWESDSEFDRTNVSGELARNDKMHSKYLNFLIDHKQAVQKYEFDLKRMRKLKWEYYSGKMSQIDLDRYKWEPFQLKLKADIPMYIESDDDIIRIEEKIGYHKKTVEAVELIMKQIHNRNYQMKSYVDWERFIGGQ